MNDEYDLLANDRMSFLDISANRIVWAILFETRIKISIFIASLQILLDI